MSNTLILLDQYTKFLIIKHLPLFYSVNVIENFFNLVHIRNPGVAFGLFADQESEYKALIFVLISSVAIVAILVIFHQTPREKRMVQIGLILIFSGAVGNMIDRILHKEVIDFLQFYYNKYYFPAFNVADACISIGVVLMILDLFSQEPEPDAPPDEPENPLNNEISDSK